MDYPAFVRRLHHALRVRVPVSIAWIVEHSGYAIEYVEDGGMACGLDEARGRIAVVGGQPRRERGRQLALAFAHAILRRVDVAGDEVEAEAEGLARELLVPSGQLSQVLARDPELEHAEAVFADAPFAWLATAAENLNAAAVA